MPRVVRRRVAGRALPLALGALAVLAGGAALAWGGAAVEADLSTERDLHGVPHATSGECQRCHPSHFASWARTFHRTMTQRATEQSVLGDFDGAHFRYGGIEARMARTADGGFQMAFYGPEGLLSRAEIVRTVGSHRYQQYLARDGDVLFRLPMAWHVEERRWFHMNGAFLTPDPPEPPPGGRIARADYMRHVTRWNDNCVFCHNVAPDPGWDPASERWDTEVAELGVACEACHGPADEHARRNANPLRRYALHLSDRPDPTIVNPRRLSPARSAEVCGRCHGQRITGDVGRFLREGDPYVPGDRLADYSEPLARDTPLDGDPRAFSARFWPDGTARLTAYEYQGLLQSPCEGLTCTTCHGMHEGDPAGQIRPSARGDAGCTGCHEELEAPEAARAHSRHADVECVDCHMPRIVYGLIDVFRSHRIEIPSPDEPSARPDACTLCHADRPRRWAARAHRAWWPTPGTDFGTLETRPQTGTDPGTDFGTLETRPQTGTDPGTDFGTLETRLQIGTTSAAAESASGREVPPDAPGGTATEPLPRAYRDALSGDPIARAVALSALGDPRGLRSARHRARRAGLLLDAMAADPYPACRRIACRSLRRIIDDPTLPFRDYVPTGSSEGRRAWVRAARERLGARAQAPDPALVDRLRAQAADVAIAIGE